MPDTVAHRAGLRGTLPPLTIDSGTPFLGSRRAWQVAVGCGD
jgi:hypothetical protein